MLNQLKKITNMKNENEKIDEQNLNLAIKKLQENTEEQK